MLLNPHNGSIISTEKFLIENYPFEKNKILNLLLNKKYIGITLDSSILFDQFNKMLIQKDDNNYNISLMNISLLRNNSVAVINETINFIREIAINSLIPIDHYRFEITNIFISLLSGINNPGTLIYVHNKIHERFNLLGIYYSETLKSFETALKIK
jgi:hypothetical protein